MRWCRKRSTMSAGSGRIDPRTTTFAMGNTNPSQATPAKKRVLIMDGHPLVRRGLTEVIGNEPDLTVCAETATYAAALKMIASSAPDLVIAEFSFDEIDYLGLVRDIHSRYPELPVLLLTVHDRPVYAQRALHAGARGYVSKREMSETLLIAIRRVLGGEQFVSQTIGLELDTA